MRLRVPRVREQSSRLEAFEKDLINHQGHEGHEGTARQQHGFCRELVKRWARKDAPPIESGRIESARLTEVPADVILYAFRSQEIGLARLVRG